MILLAIQSTYTGIEIALYNTSLTSFIGRTSIPKDKTFNLLSVINNILIDADLAICNVSYCLVNRGPAPFTTLRTVIATVNGFTAALHTPLIGMSGLKLLSKQYSMHKSSVVMLNAFAGDFYFYINDDYQGVCSTEKIKAILEQHEIETIIGNGNSLIQSAFPQENWHFINVQTGASNLETLITQGHQYIINKTNIEKYILPLYFKEVSIFQ